MSGLPFLWGIMEVFKTVSLNQFNGTCCHPIKDWFDLTSSASVRSWPRNGVVASPFKSGRPASIRGLIGGDTPEFICIDIAHTYAIAGYGKDELASLLIFLAVRCNVWGNATYEVQLERAYESFSDWCARNGKTTTILEFSKKELKISSQLVWFTCNFEVTLWNLMHCFLQKLFQAFVSANFYIQGFRTFPEDWEKDLTLLLSVRGCIQWCFQWTNLWCQFLGGKNDVLDNIVRLTHELLKVTLMYT